MHPRKFSRAAMVMVVFTRKRGRRESRDALNYVSDASRDASQRLPETMHGAVCRVVTRRDTMHPKASPPDLRRDR